MNLDLELLAAMKQTEDEREARYTYPELLAKYFPNDDEPWPPPDEKTETESARDEKERPYSPTRK